MNLNGFRVHAEYRLYQNQLCLYLGTYRDGRTHRVLPWNPVIDSREEGISLASDPSITMSREQANEVMGAMWSAGIRPPGISNESDVVVHLKEHLDDLRKELERAHIVIRELNSIMGERH